MKTLQTTPPNNRVSKIVFIILFVGILLGGSLVRVYKLGQQSLWIDEGYSINAAEAVLDRGYPILDSGEAYNGHILSTYLIAGSMKLFGFDPYSPWSARLPSVLFGIATITMAYILTYRLTKNHFVALGAMLFVAFLPWEIAWSRQARGYTMLQFFLLFSYNQLLLYIDRRKILYGLMMLVAFIGVCTSHSIGIIFLPVLLVTLATAWIRAGQKKSLSMWALGVSFCIVIVLLVGRFLAQEDFGNYFTEYGAYLLQSYPIIIIFTLGGIVGIFVKKEKLEDAVLMTSSIIIPFIIISLYTSIQFRYLLPLIPLLGILSIYGIFLFWKMITYLIPEQSLSTTTLGIMSIICMAVVMIGSRSFIIVPQASYVLDFGSPQPNFKGAYEYINTHHQPGDIIISTYAHLTKIYLGEPGIFLPISLTGKKIGEDLITSKGTDYYTGATVLNGVPGTLNMIENNHGYIIIDTMAKIRLGKLFNSIANHPKTMMVYEATTDKTTDRIWVYKF